MATNTKTNTSTKTTAKTTEPTKYFSGGIAASSSQRAASEARTAVYEKSGGKATLSQLQTAGNTAQRSYEKTNNLTPSTMANVDYENPIPASNLNTQAVNLTGINNQDYTNYSSIVTAGNTGLKDGSETIKTTTETKEPETKKTSAMRDIYDSIFGNEETPKSQADEWLRMEKEAGIKQKQQQVNDLNAQLGEITARAQADQLRVTGQGRGIPEVIIGGQQSQIAKEAAIQALPIQAQLAAAQGNLEYAQNRLETLFKLKTADADRQYNYNKDLREKAWNLALYEDKKNIEESQRTDDRKYDMFKTSQGDIKDIAMKILDKDPQTAAKLMSYSSNLSLDNISNKDISKDISTIMSGYKGDDPSVNLTPDQRLIANTILSSGKFTADQSKQMLEAIGSGMNLSSTVKNLARRDMMSGTTATKVESQETALSALDNLDGLLKEYYANGGKTNIFIGNMEKVVGKLGTINDPKLRSIATDIEAAVQTYRNAISGTAYSNQEGQAIASIFPGIDKTEGLNASILESRRKGISNLIDGQYERVLGKDVIGIISPKEKQEEVSGTTTSGKTWTSDYKSPLQVGYSGSTSSGLKFSIE
jgi:hypothetical protein